MDSEDLKVLKSRLLSLEDNLKKLLQTTQEDLILAQDLQKLLSPNRLPEVPGLKVQARYLPALQISAESFDILPTKDHKQIYFVSSWTESYGLSSLLLQSLIHLQSRALLEAKPKASLEEIFNDISTQLTASKKNSRYRFTLLRLDVASLQVTGLMIGGAPLLLKKKHEWKIVGESELQKDFSYCQPAQSAAPTLAEKAFPVHFTFEPGSRLFIMGASWNATAPSLEDFLRPLELPQISRESADLLSDFNHILVKSQGFLKARGEENDLSLLALEVDQKKLHLA